MKLWLKTSFAAAFLGLVAAACASHPQLYPNDKLKTVGKEAAHADIESCEHDADAYLESSKGKQIASGAGKGAVIGAAIGGVSGLFGGGFGRGLITGGAVGGAAGGTSGALSPDQVKHNFVDQCLHDKGYQVIGWN